MTSPLLAWPLTLESKLAERVWGGQRLGQGQGSTPIGEAWVVAEESRVAAGPLAGRTLAELASTHPSELLGRRALSGRFPLLIKLLDCADWLSVQVHPDDAQAQRLDGPGQLGKTEAWHVLDAAPGARLVGGVVPGTDPAALRRAILDGRVMDHVQYAAVQAGDSLSIPAGTVHALGPGIFLYEVQQSSDLTYRLYDWDRPQAVGRALHLPQGAEVSQVVAAAPQAAGPARPGEAQRLLATPYFALDRLTLSGEALTQDTAGESVQILTVTEGQATVSVQGEPYPLAQYASLVLPAALGRYTLSGPATLLRAALP